MVEEEDTELNAPNERMKTVPTYSLTFAENQQKGSSTTKAVNIHMESGRKEGEAIQSVSSPLAGNPEEKGDMTVSGILPGEQGAQATYQTPQPWCLTLVR